MNWRLHNRGYFSDCGQYELRPTYGDGAMSWHGRHIDSDQLVAASADREYVKGVCERHAAKDLLEAS